MKYLFFDCEFSNCFNGIEKICEIGYVLTDTSFKVLSSKDILINPGKGGRFYLRGRNGHCNCVLSHKEKEYYASRLYPSFYGEIKNIFFKKDIIVFGYAVETDLKAIDNNNRRYNLKPFNIRAYDIQKIYKKFKNGGKNCKTSLDYAASDLVPKEEIEAFVKHNPTWDALASMLVLKQIVKRTNKPLSILLGENKEFKFSLMEESILRREKEKQSEVDKQNLTYFRSLYDVKVFHSHLLPLKEKGFFLSNELMKDTDKIVGVSRLINFNGGVIKRFTSQFDYIVCKDKEDKERISKIPYYYKRKARFILPEDIKKMIAGKADF